MLQEILKLYNILFTIYMCLLRTFIYYTSRFTKKKKLHLIIKKNYYNSRDILLFFTK